MKFLKIKNLLLYPRFHSSIKEDLDNSGIDVIEINISISSKTRIIQLGLIQILENCVNELGKTTELVSNAF